MTTQDNRVWTVVDMMEWATDYFQEKSVADPRLSIDWLLSEVLQVKRLDLYLQHDRPLATAELDRLRVMVKRRAQHEPLQYITGSAQFMDATINVDPNVLIPRSETEQLTELLLKQTLESVTKKLHLLDLGTGSGCIPIAVKQKRPDWTCHGIDISEGAINLARKNAQINQVDVNFDVADLLEFTTNPAGEWDIIISNPPYITDSEKSEMNEQVLEYEPHQALFHNKPLLLYEKIIQYAAKNSALLFLECNDKTALQVAEIASRFYADSALKKDLDGNNRFVIASKANNQLS